MFIRGPLACYNLEVAEIYRDTVELFITTIKPRDILQMVEGVESDSGIEESATIGQNLGSTIGNIIVDILFPILSMSRVLHADCGFQISLPRACRLLVGVKN